MSDTSHFTVQPQRCSGIHLCSTLRLLESPPRGHNRHHRTDHHSLQKQTNQSQIELVSSLKHLNAQIMFNKQTIYLIEYNKTQAQEKVAMIYILHFDHCKSNQK